jgi:hypothetical protein
LQLGLACQLRVDWLSDQAILPRPVRLGAA